MTTQAQAHCWACWEPARPRDKYAAESFYYEALVETVERLRVPFSIAELWRAAHLAGPTSYQMARYVVVDMARHGLLVCALRTRDGRRCLLWQLATDRRPMTIQDWAALSGVTLDTARRQASAGRLGEATRAPGTHDWVIAP